MSTTTNTTNPWIGLDSYREGQILYGRSREIRDLSMAVFHNRQTVVYGRSGIGKSSLLHAGIFPEARLRGCLPISVRFNHSGEVSYSEQFYRVIRDAVTAIGGGMNDTVGGDEPSRSLWEFFHRFRPEKDGKPLTPLIVVDQFEEIFTLSKRAEQVRAFFDELADLLNDVMPDYLHASVQQSVAPAGGGSMFDGLDFQLPDNRYMQDTNFHLVLVLREDYLSYLERYSGRIPALKQNRYGLLPITYSEAMEVITQPRQGLVSPEVADTIIRQVVTDSEIDDETPVDSAILSLFLSRLYEKKGDAAVISRQLVEEQGDALLEDFYEEIVAPLDVRTIHFLEDTLINADGHRENITLESLYKNAWLQQATVEKLEKSHLLRLFSYGDVQRVEFAHDVLCPIIVKRRDQRVNRARLRRTQRRGVFAFFALVLILIGTITIIEMQVASRESLRRQQEQLGEMEIALLEKGAENMLKEHDIYGAIQLLINSMHDDYNAPSETTVRKERILRKAVDSLRLSQDSCVAKVHYTVCGPRQMTLSPSKRLVALSDESSRAFVVDGYTGSIVQAFTTDKEIKFDYSPFSATNSHNWTYLVQDGMIVESWQQSEDDNMIAVTDIHPNNETCLITNYQTIMECFVRCDWSPESNGYTRLCIHDYPAYNDWPTYVIDAAYSDAGDQIAIQLRRDSLDENSHVAGCKLDYYLYDESTGEIIQNDSSSAYAEYLIEKVEERRNHLTEEEYRNDGWWVSGISAVSGRRIQYAHGRNIYAFLNRSKQQDAQKVNIAPLYNAVKEQEDNMRAHLDALHTLPTQITDFTRSYYYDETDTILHIGNKVRYHWPLAINKSNNRIALLSPPSVWSSGIYDVYGVYPHNGAIFFQTRLYSEVHSLNFTEDDQHLVVNAGEEDEQAFFIPPLQELMDSCRNMFFDWQMTDEERYQTFIHMND